jgi:hypothetical protein
MDLSELNQSLRLSVLEQDLSVIFKAFDVYANLHLNPSIVSGMYLSHKELYDDIVAIVRTNDRINDLLELTPYIDDYIATIF